MEDMQILDLYFARSETAIDETARKYGAFLNRMALNILHSQPDTEEIVNDTYFGAWNAIPPQRPASLKHFLSRITRNLSFKRLEYQSAAKRPQNAAVMLSELEECIPDPRTEIEKTMEAKQIAEILNRFLRTVSDEDCTIFVSRYYYAETAAEISEKYALPERRVKYRLSVLRSRLREALEKEGVEV